MKKLFLCFVATVFASFATAQVQSDTLFIEKTDGSMLIIPENYIETAWSNGSSMNFVLTGGTTVSYFYSDIKGEYHKYPYTRPQFESFKFNNKFNDQLYTDAIGEIDEANGKITASVGCIGKRLTPSFKLPEGACAYIDGVLQESKKSRPRFEETVTYTVAYPNQQVYTVTSREAINSSSTSWTIMPVILTESMLSTNAPNNHDDEELVNLIDNSVNTFFHSTWGSGTHTPLYYFDGMTYEDFPENWPYLQIDLPEPIQDLQFSYTTRADTDQRGPLGLILQGSNNGETWTDLRTFTLDDDNLPTGKAGTYTSPIISCTQSYSKLRLQLTKAQYKNYLAISDFRLYKAVDPVTTYMGEDQTTIPIAPLKATRVIDNHYPCFDMELPNKIATLQFCYTTRYLGDVNKDGSVNRNDLYKLTNILLDKTGGRDITIDDINRDGILSLADITALTNAINNNSQTVCAPRRLVLMGSDDGTTWSPIKQFDDLPTEANTTYTSPVVNMNKEYKYLRFRQNWASDYDGYFTLSDLSLYHLGVVQQGGFQPYGKDYEVEVDFLTDHPTSTYKVPRIDIQFGDGQTWGWSQYISSKEYYVDATIEIDGAGVFPDMEETAMQIRGRGNSSWNGSSPYEKNPYRLKFETKVKPFGMTKGKSWVLLANKIGGSMTTNALAMKVADMVESRGCNHIIPVELYINGNYRGSYNFTENPGFSNNSIELEDETNAAMLELDSYYDETYKFYDSSYSLPVNLKEPDFEDDINDGLLTYEEANQRFNLIKQNFNAFTQDTKYGGTSHLDVDAFVRAMLVNDLVRNEECMHPKSWKLYNPDISNPDSLWTFGPVWDFDWSFGYERGSNYFISVAEEDLFSRMGSSNTGYPFFRDLLRSSDTVKRAYYLLWKEFMESGKLDELIEYCDDYFEYARPSLEHNNSQWGDGNNYQTHTNNAKSWLRKRANYIYNNLEIYDE